jgi:hypothetical protein
MPKRLAREVYDIWGNSLGWILATVPTGFRDGSHTALPAPAPKQYFATFVELQAELRRLLSDPPPDE